MKNHALFYNGFIILALFILLGCQKEAQVIINPPPDNAFDSSSLVVGLSEKTAMLDGSFDNIIDSASCLTLKLPVTLTVNGTELTIDSLKDLNAVEDIIDKSNNDEDNIQISFPITIIQADYTEIVVNNQDELHNLKSQCVENGNDADIECADFQYPITISVYDTEDQKTDVLTIKSDKELYEMLHDMGEHEIASISFPIKVMLTGGVELTINDNNELEDILKNAIGDCDEDDDNDHDDDDADVSDLVAMLTSGSWEISYFFNEIDRTDQLDGYTFIFNTNGDAKASKDTEVHLGEWTADGNDGNQRFRMVIDGGDLFDHLNEAWIVRQITDSTIVLQDKPVGEVAENFLTFQLINDNSQGGSTTSDVGDVITQGVWQVTSYKDENEDETATFGGFEFSFSADGNAQANKSGQSYQGEWSVLKSGSAEKLSFSFGVAALEDLNRAWSVEELQADKIKMRLVVELETYELVIERKE